MYKTVKYHYRSFSHILQIFSITDFKCFISMHFFVFSYWFLNCSKLWCLFLVKNGHTWLKVPGQLFSDISFILWLRRWCPSKNSVHLVLLKNEINTWYLHGKAMSWHQAFGMLRDEYKGIVLPQVLRLSS